MKGRSGLIELSDGPKYQEGKKISGRVYENSDENSELNEISRDSVKVACTIEDSGVTNLRHHVEQNFALLQLEDKHADQLRRGMLQNDGEHQIGIRYMND